MVYARNVDGKLLTFQVSGMLWNRSLVMRDLETGSLWCHLLGKCMAGPLTGDVLESLPAVMTTWADWRKEHPDTTVLDLDRTARAYRRRFYRRPEQFVFGIVHAETAKAYRFDVLKAKRVIEDEIGGEPVLVTFDPASTRATVFRRRIEGRTLSFATTIDKGVLLDRETNTSWNPRTGQAVEGPLKGKQLEMLPGIVSYLQAWRVFHPDSAYSGQARTRPR